jgi:hypothetical protein
MKMQFYPGQLLCGEADKELEGERRDQLLAEQEEAKKLKKDQERELKARKE